MDLYKRALEIVRRRDTSHFSKKAALKIISRFPSTSIYVLEAGFTPSGKVHLGNFGDVLITESVRKILELWGYKAKTILAIDSRDPFRKPPIFLPEEFKKASEKYIGKPLESIPDPYGCHRNFVEHFVEPVLSTLNNFGLDPMVVFAHEIHTDNKYIELLREVITEREKVREIFNRVHERAGHSKRYPENWIPYRPLCGGCGRIDEHVKPIRVLEDGNKIEYRCEVCGFEGIADIRKAEGKPPWRVDWVLRWVLFNVHFEPMGKDLMAAGSSYDTGREFIRGFFGREPPVAIFYDFIYWVEPGKQPQKFSKRAGIGLGAHEWLRYAPPEVLNYLLLKRHVGDIENDSLRHVDFCIYDIPKYVARFDADEREIMECLRKNRMDSDVKKALVAYFLAVKDPEKTLKRGIRRVPYDVAMRAAIWMSNVEEGLQMLRRARVLPSDASGIEIEDAITRLKGAANFVKEYWSPPIVDMELITDNTSDAERKALAEVLAQLMPIDPTKLSQETVRNVVREVSQKYGIKPRRIYAIMYLVALGEDKGPQAYRLFQKEFSRRNLELFLEKMGGAEWIDP